MSGAVTPASSIRRLISGTAAAASGTFTVTRTISEPASASSMHGCAVPAASAVSVIVIDWTTTGAPPPTWTVPTRTPIVLCSLTVFMCGQTACSAIWTIIPPGYSPALYLQGFSGGASLAVFRPREGAREMTLVNIKKPALLGLLGLTLAALPASAQERMPGPGNTAQSTVTTADIQRLQHQVYGARNELSRLRSRDSALADRL